MKGRVFVTVLLLVATHFGLHVGLGLGRAVPDLLVIAVLVAGRVLPMQWAAFLGFALGIVEDSATTEVLGASSVAMTVVGALGAASQKIFSGGSVLFLIVYFFLGSWARNFLAWAATGAESRADFGDYILFESPLVALYGTIVGILVWFFLLRDERA